MTTKPKRRRITGGVDTHKDTHHAAVVLMNGRRLADAEFPATTAGHADLVQWMRLFGRLSAVGVEGTGSYGAGLARHLLGEKVQVIEVNRPDRRQRRTKGKSDRSMPTPQPMPCCRDGPPRSPRPVTASWSRSGPCIWPGLVRSRPALPAATR
ncbi:IS110 family transposase [Nonomuraea aurantiaca]|uniref:IS110 family transposase n=1 Tax=Nonomuraea aurantiaca TaxID=2878562 RepID=UPI001CD94113|nr:IS110 family transposase [Nonomuraea aurantiaca]